MFHRLLKALLAASLISAWTMPPSAFRGLPPAWADPVAASSLQAKISRHLSDVLEFRFIREQAEKLGIRVYLFGGTAAAYAHYAKWDLQREQGDKRFQKERFDYDYTNIYRSNQDLDIVVDGTEEQARKLESLLRDKFPHLQGSKSAWEVRLLRKSMGDKEALLDNPDFLSQHTDSNSTGMIELTQPKSGEPVIRDLRDWNAKEPNFLRDVQDGKLHFYFSKSHAETSRAKKGLNPPILAAIRYLTKAFQYELAMRPEDEAIIRKIIAEFDEKSARRNDYVSKWLGKNAKKLIQNAVNIEYAWDTIERLGLRKKLIDLGGDASAMDSLAWWMNKEPLRTKPLGTQGKTAAQLGIDMVAHDTRSFQAYESITRAHTGDANVLISRRGNARFPDGFAGETAKYGDGFYTQIGRKGAVIEGLPIRFHLLPNARNGKDFTFLPEHDFVIVHNKAALQVIPESIHFGPLEYFRFLANNSEINESDRGSLEKLNRRISTKLHGLTDVEYEMIFETIAESARNGNESTAAALEEWEKVPKPVVDRYRERLDSLKLELLRKEAPPRWAIRSVLDAKDSPRAVLLLAVEAAFRKRALHQDEGDLSRIAAARLEELGKDGVRAIMMGIDLDHISVPVRALDAAMKLDPESRLEVVRHAFRKGNRLIQHSSDYFFQQHFRLDLFPKGDPLISAIMKHVTSYRVSPETLDRISRLLADSPAQEVFEYAPLGLLDRDRPRLARTLAKKFLDPETCRQSIHCGDSFEAAFRNYEITEFAQEQVSKLDNATLKSVVLSIIERSGFNYTVERKIVLDALNKRVFPERDPNFWKVLEKMLTSKSFEGGGNDHDQFYQLAVRQAKGRPELTALVEGMLTPSHSGSLTVIDDEGVMGLPGLPADKRLSLIQRILQDQGYTYQGARNVFYQKVIATGAIKDDPQFLDWIQAELHPRGRKPDPRSWPGAVLGLKWVPSEKAIPLLKEQIQIAKHPEIQNAAAEALIAHHPPDLIGLLAPALQNSRKGQNPAAVKWLSDGIRNGDPEAIEFAKNLLSDHHYPREIRNLFESKLGKKADDLNVPLFCIKSRLQSLFH